MRIALISDLHANLQALEAVLADIGEKGADSIYCVGDIVGYGARPAECIERLKERCEGSVEGNHDSAVIGETDAERFKPAAKKAAEWTSEILGFEEKSFLSGLPLTLSVADSLLVHATPRAPSKWEYLLYESQLPTEFAGFDERLCFIGHSHRPVIWSDSGERIPAKTDERFKLLSGRRYIINVGSVGQPRDRDPRSCYVIFDADGGTIEFRRVEYDIEAAATEILDAGLPPVLASRLYNGV